MADNKNSGENYYYQTKGIIRESLLTTEAQKWAKSFVNGRPSLQTHQLRRFYNEVKSLEAKSKAMGFDRVLPLIKMLQSKVAFACPKSFGGRKVPEEFKNFIDLHITKVKKQEDFNAFVLVFESVVGYFYGEGGR